jgi:2-amino-4-hydroxy-6-hydroxymethyldihydropteridine diphosphokinase
VTKHVEAFIGLGSNLGDRAASLRFAVHSVAELSQVEVEAVSRVYESEAVGPGVQGPYLNAAIKVRCGLSAEALLDGLLAIEVQGGRDRASDVERWGPRTLDLDLLFYGDACIEQVGLSLPHPRLHERAFVLEPLCDLAPDYVHPREGVSVVELARKFRDASALRVWPESLEVPS